MLWRWKQKLVFLTLRGSFERSKDELDHIANGGKMIEQPAQRTWVGLTHEEHMEIMTGTMTTSSRMAAVEAKLKEKNNG